MDLAESINGNSITATGVFFSILTAYLLAAYFAGTKLTKYQVAFINVVFLFYNLIAASNLAITIRGRIALSQRLIEMSGEETMFSEEVTIMIISLFILMRLLLVLGAMGFMWQVRHQKTE